MTNYPKSFGDATQAIAAFKITAQALIAQGENAVSEHDPVGDTPYNVLRDISQTVPFSAVASDFKDMLEVVPSPLAERLAVLAIERAQTYHTAGQQVAFQLHLADVSEAVPGFGDELPPANELRKDVVEFLTPLKPAQLARLHEEADKFLKGMSVDGRSIMAESVYSAAFEISQAESPSPLIADRLHAVMLNNIEAEEVSARYGDATCALYKVASVNTQRAILSEKIDSIITAADADDMIRSDAVLSQFGSTLEDFIEADGTAKSADFFIPRTKNEGQDQAPAPKQS